MDMQCVLALEYGIPYYNSRGAHRIYHELPERLCEREKNMADALLKNRPSINELMDNLVPNSNAGPVIVRGRCASVEDDVCPSYLVFEVGPGVVSTCHCHPLVVAAINDLA